MYNGKVRQGKSDAPWMKVAKVEELQRVSVINERLTRKNVTVSELLAEKKRIMARCVKRLSRRKKAK